jgi:hypothetical protein
MLLKPVVCPIEKLAKVKNNKNKNENLKLLLKRTHLLFSETSFRKKENNMSIRLLIKKLKDILLAY